MTVRLPDRRTDTRHITGVAGRYAIRTTLVASLVVTVAGCDLFAVHSPERNPSVVGVIASSENVTGVWHYQLENGKTVDIDFDETETLPDSRGGGDPGTLLFYDDRDDAWYMGLFPARDGSYTYDAAATDDATHIVFENGLRLPKAAGSDGRGWPQGGRYESPAGEAGFGILARSSPIAALVNARPPMSTTRLQSEVMVSW